MFWFMLVVGLGVVKDRGLSLVGGVQVGPFFRQSFKGQPYV